MQLRYFIFVTVIFLLLAGYSYQNFDQANLSTMIRLTNQYPLLLLISKAINVAFSFIIWFFLDCIFLLLSYCRAKNFKQFMASKATQFWLGLFLTMIFSSVIKVVFGRYRPEMFVTHHLYGFSVWSLADAKSSMPSNHTALFFSCATTLGYFLHKKWTYVLFYLIAALLACSRCLILKHYPSDVLVGAFVGMWGSYFAYYFCHHFRKIK